eukprot:6490870-Amphidinium_carterae.1
MTNQVKASCTGTEGATKSPEVGPVSMQFRIRHGTCTTVLTLWWKTCMQWNKSHEARSPPLLNTVEHEGSTPLVHTASVRSMVSNIVMAKTRASICQGHCVGARFIDNEDVIQGAVKDHGVRPPDITQPSSGEVAVGLVRTPRNAIKLQSYEPHAARAPVDC